MPAIYTFSLDFRRDRDIIDLLESKKNRSNYIRQNLREEILLNLYMEAFDLLYSRYRTAMEVHAGRDPIPKSHFLTANKYAKSKEEEEKVPAAADTECFTCNEIGEEHCNIHMNYDSEE